MMPPEASDREFEIVAANDADGEESDTAEH